MTPPRALVPSSLALALVAAVALAPAARADAAPRPAPSASVAPSDSTDALAWARAVVRARRAVEAAEAELDLERQAALAEEALGAVRAVAAAPGAEASLRGLALRAHAVYEAHFGPVAGLDLGPAELAALRGDALAALGPNFAPPLRDPAEVAAERAAQAAAARAAAAEAARAEGPDWLFYPASAAPLVDAQRGSAGRLARAGRRGRGTLRQIARTLRRRGLPADLQYVAVIESALDPRAESHAGAQGLWQFMPETAAEYGLDSLTVFEPAPATEAAARYLRWLSRRFDGDWHLALAAYNCGVGRVEGLARAFRAETGRRATFWDLHDALPRETRHYVPRFIAVAEAMGARG